MSLIVDGMEFLYSFDKFMRLWWNFKRYRNLFYVYGYIKVSWTILISKNDWSSTMTGLGYRPTKYYRAKNFNKLCQKKIAVTGTSVSHWPILDANDGQIDSHKQIEIHIILTITNVHRFLVIIHHCLTSSLTPLISSKYADYKYFVNEILIEIWSVFEILHYINFSIEKYPCEEVIMLKSLSIFFLSHF